MTAGAQGKKVMRKAAGEIPRPDAEGLARLRALKDRPVDTSEAGDAPETVGPLRPVAVGPEGRPLRRPPDLFRDAILARLDQLGMNRGQLYRKAREYCPTLSESAVYEYLRGQRDVQSAYLSALLKAAELTIRPVSRRRNDPARTS